MGMANHQRRDEYERTGNGQVGLQSHWKDLSRESNGYKVVRHEGNLHKEESTVRLDEIAV